LKTTPAICLKRSIGADNKVLRQAFLARHIQIRSSISLRDAGLSSRSPLNTLVFRYPDYGHAVELAAICILLISRAKAIKSDFRN